MSQTGAALAGGPAEAKHRTSIYSPQLEPNSPPTGQNTASCAQTIGRPGERFEMERTTQAVVYSGSLAGRNRLQLRVGCGYPGCRTI